MAAPKGNQFWKKVIAPTGRPKKYTPKTLWAKAVEYFEWNTRNPLYESKAFATGKVISLPKMRAMTEVGFRLFAGISNQTWASYKSGEEPYKDFLETSTRISEIIYQQKFEGAAADFFNAGIIGKELGLSEKHELTGKDGNPLLPAIDYSKLSEEELDLLMKLHGKATKD